MWLPFIFLVVGALLAGLLKSWAHKLMNFSLYLLLLGLGARIGRDAKLLAAVPELGGQALMICLLASAFSIIAVVLCERFFLAKNPVIADDKKEPYQAAFSSEYIFIITVMIILCLGIGMGHFFRLPDRFLAQGINAALVVIYISVGVGLKEGLSGLQMKTHGTAFILVPLAILAGSLIGGITMAVLSSMDGARTAAIGGGVGYYSLTAAMVTQKAGPELGLTAFLANFFREVLTFFLTPFLARLSKWAPIALGGATTMDTTLAVMKRCLGEEQALLAFISGAVLTVAVPLMLMLVLSI